MEKILERLVRYRLRVKEPGSDFLRILMAEVSLRREGVCPMLQDTQGAVSRVLTELFDILGKRRLPKHGFQLSERIQVFKMVHSTLAMVWLSDSPPSGDVSFAERRNPIVLPGIDAARPAMR